MAHTRSPLLSQSASGTLGGQLTYSRGRKQTTIRHTPRRRGPLSDRQQTSANWMRWLIRQWAPLSAANKTSWDFPDDTAAISPYHNFLGLNSIGWAHNRGPSKSYPATRTSTTPTAPVTTITPGLRHIAFLWDWDTGYAPEWAYILYRHPVTTPFNIKRHLRTIITPYTTPLPYIDDAPSGSQIRYFGRGLNDDGKITGLQYLGDVVAD